MSEVGEKTLKLKMGFVGPMCPKLVMVKTLICGPLMKMMKKTKMITEKSSFKKV